MDIENIKKESELREKRGHLVVKDNELIQKAQFCLTAEQQKLVCYAVSLIKPTDEVFCHYEIKATDFAELCGISQKHIYTDFKKMVDELDQKAVWIQMGDKTFKFRWFSEAEYIEKKGIIKVMLNSNIKQYLLQLKSNFTQYELWNILALKSKWSIRLYELFKSYEYQHRKTFEFEELKELLGSSYNLFGDFKRRILDKAKEEINLYSDINVEYEVLTIGKGHKVKDITFIITKKDNFDGYLAYRNTIEQINKRNKNKQIKGQMILNSDLTITEEEVF